MIGTILSSLKKEKRLLVNEYMKAPPKDKARLLVRIIDVDNKLDDLESEARKTALGKEKGTLAT